LVISRDMGSDSAIFRNKCVEYFDKYGRDDFVLTHYVVSKTVSGRLKSRVPSTSTIVGDLQFDNKQLRSLIFQGIAKTGDGIFYTLGSNSIELSDEITIVGKSYKLTRQVEGEDLNKTIPYTGWLAVLIPEA